MGRCFQLAYLGGGPLDYRRRYAAPAVRFFGDVSQIPLRNSHPFFFRSFHPPTEDSLSTPSPQLSCLQVSLYNALRPGVGSSVELAQTMKPIFMKGRFSTMENTLVAATAAVPSKKMTKAQLAKFRQSSPLKAECFWNRLTALKRQVTLTTGLGRDRISIQIKNPETFFDLQSLERDCRLKENATFCPGSAGTIAHTYLGENKEAICFDTSHPDDLRTLLFQCRLSDLDPPPVPTA